MAHTLQDMVMHWMDVKLAGGWPEVTFGPFSGQMAEPSLGDASRADMIEMDAKEGFGAWCALRVWHLLGRTPGFREAFPDAASFPDAIAATDLPHVLAVIRTYNPRDIALVIFARQFGDRDEGDAADAETFREAGDSLDARALPDDELLS